MNEWMKTQRYTHFYLDFIYVIFSNIFSFRFFAWKDCEGLKKRKEKKRGKISSSTTLATFLTFLLKKIFKRKLGHAFKHGLCILLGLLQQQHHNARSSLDFYEQKYVSFNHTYKK